MQDGATENIRTYGLYNGKPAVFVTIYQQPGANVIEMIDAVKAELPLLKGSIDPKIDLVVTFDRSITIRASLRQVEQTLMLAVAMVILVVYIFLNSYRAALIPALVVPVSLIGTFGAMYLLDYTLDNFSSDGAHHRHRIRRGRCDRGHGKHHPAHRSGHGAHGRRVARCEGSRIHGRLHEPVPGRRVHPLHVRRRDRRPNIPGVHRHPVGRHPDLAGGFPDHHADDVFAPARAATAAANSRGSRRRSSGASSACGTGYVRTLGLGARSSAHHAADAHRHHRAQSSSCTS